MKTQNSFSILSLLIVPINSGTTGSNSPVSYLIGGIIALLILGYLIYTLMRPEKF